MPRNTPKLTESELYNMRKWCSADVLRLLDEHTELTATVERVQRIANAWIKTGPEFADDPAGKHLAAISTHCAEYLLEALEPKP